MLQMIVQADSASETVEELGEICDSVVVIEKGERVVAGAIEDIQREAQSEQVVTARALGDVAALSRHLQAHAAVGDVLVDGASVRFGFAGGDETLAELLASCVEAGHRMVEFALVSADLEDLFLKATKGRLQ